MKMILSNPYLELQQRFLAGLQRRLSDLTALLCETADPEPLMRMFHSLAGIGGTYGYAHISEVARQQEELCVSVIEQKRSLTPAEFDQLENAVTSIHAAAFR